MNYFENMIGATESPTVKSLTAALSKAQSEFTVIEQDRVNDHLRSKYATFQGCCQALRGPLTKNGFAMPTYQPCRVDGEYVMIGVLRHESGEFITAMVPLINPDQQRIDKRTGEVTVVPAGMQGLGAAITYAKRQLLLALTGAWVGEVDDDGESVQPQAASPAQDAVQGMELVARAYHAIQKSREDADKALDWMKLQVHKGKVKRDLYDKLANEYKNKWGEA